MATSSDPTPPAAPGPVRRPRTSFLAELQRRHVPRVGLLYLAVSWLLLKVADILLPVFDAPAWEAFWRNSNVDPAFVRPLVAAVRDPSRRDAALAAVRALEDRADAGQPGNSVAHRLAPYLRLGAVDAALDELEMRLAQGPHRRFVLLTMLWEPDARAIRASRRFTAFAADVGLVDFWHQRGWPGFCEPAGASLACRHRTLRRRHAGVRSSWRCCWCRCPGSVINDQ